MSLISSLAKEVNNRSFQLRLQQQHFYTNLDSAIAVSVDYGTGYLPILPDSVYSITLPAHISDTFFISLRTIVGTDTLMAYAKTIVAPQ